MESAMKKTEDINTLMFMMDVKANKAPEQQSLAKVNTLITHDGEKKAYIVLAPDCDAFDVANKIGIIWTESSWQILTIKILCCKK